MTDAAWKCVEFAFGDGEFSGFVIVEKTDGGMTISVKVGDQCEPMFDMLRDQWGVWIEMFAGSIAQEDKTRSFLDAVIKALTYARRLEFETLPAIETRAEP